MNPEAEIAAAVLARVEWAERHGGERRRNTLNVRVSDLRALLDARSAPAPDALDRALRACAESAFLDGYVAACRQFEVNGGPSQRVIDGAHLRAIAAGRAALNGGGA